ncbi:1546_t:CDS:2, partial [Racocetra fulgida]
MTDVNISTFIPTIKTILKNSDPNEITARDIRMKLEKDFNVDLTDRKHEVQQLIEKCFDDLEIGEESANSDESDHDIKVDSQSIESLSDDEYERKFEAELNGVSKKSKSTSKKKKHKKKKKGVTGIHKPLVLSPVLSEFLHAEELSRLEVVKRLWAYIKENSLQDPNDKRFIVCDENLKNIFKQDRIHSFTMNKYLTDHLKKKEDLVDMNVSSNGSDHVEQSNASSAGDDETHNDK